MPIAGQMLIISFFIIIFIVIVVVVLVLIIIVILITVSVINVVIINVVIIVAQCADSCSGAAVLGFTDIVAAAWPFRCPHLRTGQDNEKKGTGSCMRVLLTRSKSSSPFPSTSTAAAPL